MIKNINRFSSDFSRELKNINFSFRLNGVVFGLVFIVFGLFGILPLATNIKTKLALLSEMQDRNSIMQSNMTKLEAASTSLNLYASNIDYLDRYMPIETKLQDYVVDFVGTAGANGYVVRGFSQDPDFTDIQGQNSIQVFLDGTQYPTDLIRTIENLKRVTQVKSVTLVNSPKDGVSVTLYLTIYNYVL